MLHWMYSQTGWMRLRHESYSARTLRATVATNQSPHARTVSTVPDPGRPAGPSPLRVRR